MNTINKKGKGIFGSLKGFSQAFWVANSVELFERMAYYAFFISLTLYLSNVWGFGDFQAGIIAGTFSALLYLLPMFSGALADKIGFRISIIFAFSLLTVGYIGLALLPTFLESSGLVTYGFGDNTRTIFSGLENSVARWSFIPALLSIVLGGSFIKSVISGTVAKETSSENRAKGFSIFYMMVNIGAFTGKTVVDPLRKSLGDSGLIYVQYFSGIVCLIALITVFFLYKTNKEQGKGKSFGEIWNGLVKVVTNGRLLVLILIVTGFWIVQQQLYASMPKYVIRMVGEDASPGWYANVNPLIVVFCVNFVTSLMKKRRAITSMTIGMFIIPFSALIMAGGNLIGNDYILGLHPVAFMMILGIIFQALAECFISPRYFEYFSLQSPKGEEGLYLGFSQLHSFFSSIFGFILGGALLEKFCPDPNSVRFMGDTSSSEYIAATANAHYLWYFFVGIGLVSACALFTYDRITKRKDKQKLV
ncbi:MFS transporter [Bacteroidales bacterium OttesenSCG-928-M11]|nr:MFS transporter [Bacteroidales bacterium OttesenSCG-928-M11]